jgi:Protein of unknown function (DUF2855)
MSTGQRFAVERAMLSNTHIETFDAEAALAPGQSRLRIDHFALTANNITYAVFGESMHYWRFFPADDAARGCVPVWGYATVEASACDGLAVGQRCFGFWPMATHLVVQPAMLSADGFVDASERRAALPAIYNRYQRVHAQDADREGVYATLRPLFATAWLIADFMQQSDDFGARTMLLSSASSKTAYATAFCLKRRAGAVVRVVGATSASRLASTSALGVYDDVIGYEALRTLAAGEPAVYIDFSGDAALRRAVHGHWQDALAYSCSVGGTHHAALGSGGGLPGPKPQLFFAPTQMQQRAAPPPQGLGRAALMQEIDDAWHAFAARATQGASPWLTIEHRRGVDAMRAAYLDMLDGRADAGRGSMLSF